MRGRPPIPQAEYEHKYGIGSDVFVVIDPKAQTGWAGRVIELLPPRTKSSSVPCYRLRGPRGGLCIRTERSIFKNAEEAFETSS